MVPILRTNKVYSNIFFNINNYKLNTIHNFFNSILNKLRIKFKAIFLFYEISSINFINYWPYLINIMLVNKIFVYCENDFFSVLIFAIYFLMDLQFKLL